METLPIEHRSAADSAPEELRSPGRPTSTRSWQTTLTILAGFVVGTLLLCGPALVNGFPLVYFDSGAYIAMSVQHRPHLERLVAYGLFIMSTGFDRTLWPAIVLQGLIVFWLIHQTFGRLTSVRRPTVAAVL